MRNLRFSQGLINGKLGFHDRVVRGGKDGVHAIAHDGFSCLHDLSHVGAGVFLHFNALFSQDFLCRGNGSRGSVLRGIVKQADLLCIRIGGEDQVQHRGGVQVVRGAGDVGAGLFQAFHQFSSHRIRHGSENHRNSVIRGHTLHTDRHRRRNAHHQVHFIGDEVGNNLLHHAGVQVAVVFDDFKGNSLFLPDLAQPFPDVRDDLVQARVVHKVADTDFEACLFLRGSQGNHGEYHNQGQYQCQCLFHCFVLPFICLS